MYCYLIKNIVFIKKKHTIIQYDLKEEEREKVRISLHFKREIVTQW